MRVLIAVLFFLGGLAAAEAADLGSTEPRRQHCASGFNNWWIWGDPTDCPGDETLPACDAADVLSRVKAFVARAEPVYLVPEIAEIFHVAEQPQTLIGPSPLVKRYCRANVVLTDGNQTTAYYFMQEDAGFVGLSWKVYVCLIGYDEWRIYDGDCRVARPAVVY